MENIELRYNTVQMKYENGQTEEAKNDLEALLEELENEYKDRQRCYSFSHVLEVYLFINIKGADGKEIAYCEHDFPALYHFYGQLLTELGDFSCAIGAYERALYWNPVDVDAMFALTDLYKASAETEQVNSLADQAYAYCISRSDMAKYYRAKGYCAIEGYKPALAIALYQYSNIFYPSQKAKDELAYLEKAQGKPIKELSVNEIQSRLKQASMPIGPKEDTIGLLYQVAHVLLANGKSEDAIDCFKLVYDITQDKEIEQLLAQLTAK
jgi:tetratricopeptide (TPR) repeat protein